MTYRIFESIKGGFLHKRVAFYDALGNQIDDYTVQKDNEGREYFHVPNIFSDGNMHLFIGCVKDAIETIRAGWGDALNVTTLFGVSESVIKYVDREYGEKIRSKTIKCFENSEFGYSLKFGNLNSLSGSNYITESGDVSSLFKSENYIFFDSKEAATKHMEELIAKAKEIFDLAEAESNEEKRIELIKTTSGSYSAIRNILYALNDDKSENKKTWKLEVVQVFKN